MNKPSVIVNCGAYTAVDSAETEFELAKKVNDEAVGYISNWSSENDCRLIHISTDFVFDGKSNKARTSAHPNAGKQCPFFDGIYTSVMRRIFNQGFHKYVTFETLVLLYV